MQDAASTTLDQELAQVLKGLALNREPGWNFPGNFLEISFDDLGPAHSSLSLEAGPHCLDADGQVNLGAFSLLADIALATALRGELGMTRRMATVSMTLQFTGAPRHGPLQAHGRLDGVHDSVSGARQGMSRAEVYAGDTLVCTASGSFMGLDTHPGLHPLPVRRRGEGPEALPLSVDELDDTERRVYERARACLAPGPGSFIERFWSFLPMRQKEGACCEFDNGPQAGNRVGHTQGGLTFGLAAATANAALGQAWSLIGISAWYLRPGTGPALQARASIVHRGNYTAVVRVEVADHAGRSVLEAVTNHSRTAS